MHLEAVIVRPCRPWSCKLGGRDRASLEIHLEAVIERVWRCTPRLWSSEVGGAHGRLGWCELGGRNQASLEIHLEPVIEQVSRCTPRPSSSEFEGALLQGFFIPIINTTFIELSTTAYLRNSFFPRLILRLNLLHLTSKSDQSVTVPKTVSSVNEYLLSSLDYSSSEISSNGNNPVRRYLNTK